MKLTILHFSDFHCNSDDEIHMGRVGKALADDIVAQAANGLKADIVCVTGDLINKGENGKAEFDLAEELFFRPIREASGLQSKQFFFAPGNHEIDRSHLF